MSRMMQEIVTRCGYRCDLCLAYRPNVEACPSNQQTLSDGWYSYFGFRIPAEQIICDGCMAKEPHLIDTACPVRPCVIERGYANCSQCPDYGCEKLVERLVVCEDIAAHVGGAIPEEDRARFIAPYENKRRLDDLRGQTRCMVYDGARCR
jgi:hypothetical protein